MRRRGFRRAAPIGRFRRRSGAIAFMRRALLSRNRFFLRKETSRQGSGKDEKRKEALGGGERKGRVGESMRGGERGGEKKEGMCGRGRREKEKSGSPPLLSSIFPASSMKLFIAGLICLANRNEKTRNRERKKRWGRKEEKDQGEKRPPQAGRKKQPIVARPEARRRNRRRTKKKAGVWRLAV